MDITINNTVKTIGEFVTVSDMLNTMGIVSAGIAVAVNNNIIPKPIWIQHILQPGDSVTIIKATQGG